MRILYELSIIILFCILFNISKQNKKFFYELHDNIELK